MAKVYKINPWMIATFVLVVLTVFSVLTGFNVTGLFVARDLSGFSGRSDFGASGAPITIDLFVMSQCPYGVQAEDGLFGVIDAFGSDVQVNIRFIVSDLGGGNFGSLHGQPELDENLRQLCIMQNYPDKFFEYLECFNPNYRSAESQFAACAAQLGFDANMINNCITSDNAVSALQDDVALTTELGVRGSPTYYINGEKYSGGRDAASVQSYICNLNPTLSGCSAQLSGTQQQPSGSC
jgi:hypothetical protein